MAFWVSGVFVGVAEIMNHIDCELRTYMRLGLGYMTAVAAFPGFLPYTLYVDFWGDLSRQTTIIRVKHVPDIFSDDPAIQALVGLAYGVVIFGLLYWSVRRGMRLTGFSFDELMTHANDELTIKYFDRYAKEPGGQSGDEVKDIKTGDTVNKEPVCEGG